MADVKSDSLAAVLAAGSVGEALAKVAEVARLRKQAIDAASVGDTAAKAWDSAKGMAGQGVEAAKGLGEKAVAASPDWLKGLGDTAGGYAKQVWDNPHARTGLIGAGIGAGLGGLSALANPRRRKRWMGDALTTGLLGGAAGGGLSLGYDKLLGRNLGDDVAGLPGRVMNAFSPGSGGGGGGADGKVDHDAKLRAAIDKLPPEQRAPVGDMLQKGYNQLDSQGFKRKPVQQAAAGVREGTTTPEAALAEIKKQAPGMQGVGSRIWNNAMSGNPVDLLDELDVPGLKNVIPGSGHFDPVTGAEMIGANVGARMLQNSLSRSGNGTQPGMLRQFVGKQIDRVADLPTTAESQAGAVDHLRQLRLKQEGTMQKVNDLSAKLRQAEAQGLPPEKLEPMRIEVAKARQASLDAHKARTVGVNSPLATPEKPGLLQRAGNWTQDKVIGGARQHQDNILEKERAVYNNAHVDKPLGQKALFTDPAGKKSPVDVARQQRAQRLTDAAGKPGTLKKVTGGLFPTLAAAAPLILKEWGGSGYRSGDLPARNIITGNQALGQ